MPSCQGTPGQCKMSLWLSSATPLPISQTTEPSIRAFCSGPHCHDLPMLPLLMSTVCSFSGLSITPAHLSKGIYLGCYHLELPTPASWDFLSQSGIPGHLLRDSVSKETVPLHVSALAVWPGCHSSCYYPPYFVSMPAGTAAILQLFWSMSPLANGVNEVCFLYLLVICICSLVKHLLNPSAPSGCFLWIVEVLYIFGLYRLLPRCYDKMSKKKHLERKDLLLPVL